MKCKHKVGCPWELSIALNPEYPELVEILLVRKGFLTHRVWVHVDKEQLKKLIKDL